MKDLFISHVEEDSEVALALADLLARNGFTTWTYERDSVPGISYLIQTSEAIEQSRGVLLVISVHALGSHQVTKELVRAHESNKPILPLLLGISHAQFQKRQPEWRAAIGAAASLAISREQVDACIPKILESLKFFRLTARENVAQPKGEPRVDDDHTVVLPSPSERFTGTKGEGPGKNARVRCVRCGNEVVLTDHVLALEGIDRDSVVLGALLPLQLACSTCGGVIADYRVVKADDAG
jgi:hypothetical protein